MNPLAALRRLYDWMMGLAEHPHAVYWLALIAFCEASFFPLPQDILMIPLILAQRQRAFKIAAICTVASVAGGMFGYLIGYGLFEAVGKPIIAFYGYGNALDHLREAYHQYGWWIVIGGGLTPLPYKVVTIASGAMGLDIKTFFLASVLSRGGRFIAIALLLWWFGAPIKKLIEERFGIMATLFFILLVGGFVVIKYLI